MKKFKIFIALTILGQEAKNFADFYKKTGTLAEKSEEKLVMIQSEKVKKIHYVIKSPNISTDQMQNFTQKCGHTFNITAINVMISILVMESQQGFITHDKTVKTTVAPTTAP